GGDGEQARDRASRAKRVTNVHDILLSGHADRVVCHVQRRIYARARPVFPERFSLQNARISGRKRKESSPGSWPERHARGVPSRILPRSRGMGFSIAGDPAVAWRGRDRIDSAAILLTTAWRRR